MLIFLTVVSLAAIAAISWFFWKSGFLMDAEKPKPLIDKPITDPKERKAVLKRLKRWREEGRLTREEYERFSSLCSSEWDG